MDFESETFLVAHALRADGFDASADGTGRGTPLVPTYTLAIRGRGDSHDLEYRADGSANAVLTPNGGRGGIGVGAIAFSAKDHGADAMQDCSPTLRAGGHADSHANAGVMPAVAFQYKASPSNSMNPGNVAPTLDKGKSDGMSVHAGMQVRRLTPLETERLQGFHDYYTLIPIVGRTRKRRKNETDASYAYYLEQRQGQLRSKDGPRYKSHGNSWAINCVRWIGERIDQVDAIGIVPDGLLR